MPVAIFFVGAQCLIAGRIDHIDTNQHAQLFNPLPDSSTRGVHIPLELLINGTTNRLNWLLYLFEPNQILFSKTRQCDLLAIGVLTT